MAILYPYYSILNVIKFYIKTLKLGGHNHAILKVLVSTRIINNTNALK